VVTLGITFWAGRCSRAAGDFYAGGREFSPLQNGFASSEDYMSAASFLGVTGLITLYGYDGLLYTIGFLVAWLVLLMLVAELVRNCGWYTVAGFLRAPVRAGRLRAPPVKDRCRREASSVGVAQSSGGCRAGGGDLGPDLAAGGLGFRLRLTVSPRG
jgi:hypothetical protein